MPPPAALMAAGHTAAAGSARRRPGLLWPMVRRALSQVLLPVVQPMLRRAFRQLCAGLPSLVCLPIVLCAVLATAQTAPPPVQPVQPMTRLPSAAESGVPSANSTFNGPSGYGGYGGYGGSSGLGGVPGAAAGGPAERDPGARDPAAREQALREQAARERAQRASAEPPPEDSDPEPGEFERLVALNNGGVPVLRLGARPRRVAGPLADRESPARVPPHYVVQVGDEVSITVWGSVDAQWLLRVDRAGRVTLPRVGPVPLAGETAGGLEARLRERLGRVFKGFELAVAVTDVSPVRVHVTGFVERPGDIVVPGLTTLSGAIALARGPAAGGSFRRIRLVRDERTQVSFDLYTLLREGRRRDDLLLQPGDVIYIEAAGPQAAVLGSVNRPAIVEFMPGETLGELLRLAGGFAPLADRSALLLEPVAQRREQGALQLAMPEAEARVLRDGDVLRVKSLAATAGSSQLRNKRVLVEGEVRNPGEYLLPPLATLADALRAAGGTTPAAFLYGTQLRRDSVRLQQEENYERALRELETEVVRAAADRVSRSENAPDLGAQTQQLLARLRNRRPDGRVVLEVGPEAGELPPLALEDGDRLLVPTRNQSVGVFGSVYSAGNFSHGTRRDLGHYIRRAGGPSAGADYSAAFVVRANGSVISARQEGSWWTRSESFEALPALPGDTVFVPEDIFRGRFVQGARDWTQILYQLGVGLAAFRTFR